MKLLYGDIVLKIYTQCLYTAKEGSTAGLKQTPVKKVFLSLKILTLYSLHVQKQFYT